MAIEISTSELDSLWAELDQAAGLRAAAKAPNTLPAKTRLPVVGRVRVEFHLKRYEVQISYGTGFEQTVQGRLIWDTRSQRFGEIFLSDRLPPGQQLRIQSAEDPDQDIEAVVLRCGRLTPRFLANFPMHYGCKILIVSSMQLDSPFRHNLEALLNWQGGAGSENAETAPASESYAVAESPPVDAAA